MAIRADSYGTVNEVRAFTRHLLDGQSTFNSTTRPTVTDLEGFIDRASGVLNMAFRVSGFAPSAVTANSTAKLAADDWVVLKATEYTELTQRGTGYSGAEGSRTGAFNAMLKDATAYVGMLTLGLKREGVAVAVPTSQGLTFTGLDKRSERADPDNSNREQPAFRRHLFDNPGSVALTGEDDD